MPTITLGDDILTPTRIEFQKTFAAFGGIHERLGKVVAATVGDLLQSEKINVLDVGYRAKAADAAFDKYIRKRYTDTAQIDDMCGIRIICYYPSDIDKIAQVLKSEFSVQEEEDTALRLAPHQFGYRSTHFILNIKRTWLVTPQYREFKDLRFEVQVRTILMHAWAEIQHKLAYKSSDQIPDQFQRKLYRLSAKFEEADEQFEEIRTQLEAYRKEVKAEVSKKSFSPQKHGLNLDTLQVFLDTTYPDRDRSLNRTAQLLAELNDLHIKLANVVDASVVCSTFLPQIEKISMEENNKLLDSGLLFYSQTGALRKCLDIVNEKFFSARQPTLSKNKAWTKSTDQGRRLLEELQPHRPARSLAAPRILKLGK